MAGAVVQKSLDGRNVDEGGRAEQDDGARQKAKSEPQDVVILVMMDRGNHLRNSLRAQTIAYFDINVNYFAFSFARAGADRGRRNLCIDYPRYPQRTVNNAFAELRSIKRLLTTYG